MNASLNNSQSKRGQNRGLNQIKSKISALQNQYQKLLIQRQQDIASLISTLDLAHVDDQLLLGGLIFLKEKITTHDSIMEEWRNAGERFLRTIKPKRQSHPKPITPSSSPTQSPQKHPQSREK